MCVERDGQTSFTKHKTKKWDVDDSSNDVDLGGSVFGGGADGVGGAGDLGDLERRTKRTKVDTPQATRAGVPGDGAERHPIGLFWVRGMKKMGLRLAREPGRRC